MIDAPLTLAFAAGLVATVNPCGFAMLPAYLSYFMGLEEDQTSRSRAMRSALAVGTVVSIGFLVVFGLAGLLITAGFRFVIGAIPWFAGVVGVGIVALGISLLFGREVTIGLPKARRATSGRGYRSVFLFGVSYAVASLSCTLPVFLTVVATQVTRGSFVSGGCDLPCIWVGHGARVDGNHGRAGGWETVACRRTRGSRTLGRQGVRGNPGGDRVLHRLVLEREHPLGGTGPCERWTVPVC